MVKDISENRVLLGHISTAHGIRGDVLVKTHTVEPASIASYGALTDAAGQAPLKLKVLRVTPKGVVARVAGVADRNGAEALRGRELWVARSAMPEPSEDEFYHADLIGMAAFDEAGAALGTVIGIENYGAGDLVEIRGATGGATELVPFTKAFVPVIDFANRRIVVAMVYAEVDGDEPPAADDADEPPSR